MDRNDLTGRILGILVFLAGIGVLAGVFAIAYTFFTSQSSVLPISSDAKMVASPASQLGAAAVAMLARILSLALMAAVGSIIAGKGLQMYFHAGRGCESGGRSKQD